MGAGLSRWRRRLLCVLGGSCVFWGAYAYVRGGGAFRLLRLPGAWVGTHRRLLLLRRQAAAAEAPHQPGGVVGDSPVSPTPQQPRTSWEPPAGQGGGIQLQQKGSKVAAVSAQAGHKRGAESQPGGSKRQAA